VIGMGNTSTITSIYEGGNSLGFRPLADEAALDGWVRILRPQVDLVVVVSHLGLDEDEDLTASQVEEDPNQAFQQKTLAGVDLILGGHLHIVTNPPKIIPNDDKGHQTILVHSGAFAKFVGRPDVVVRVGDATGTHRRSRITAPLVRQHPRSKLCDGSRPRIRHREPDVAVLVKINQDIDLTACSRTSTKTGRREDPADASGGDSQLGNMVVARSMQLQSVEAEFAITNSLGVRADFERGPLTIEQMYNVFPFENSITVIYLSGQEVQETLDYVAQRSATRGCRTQAQVSGIAFDMVCNGPNGAYAKNIVIGDNCRQNGNPDGEMDTLKCAPLVPSSLYRVAVNDYIGRRVGFEVQAQHLEAGHRHRCATLRVFLNQRSSTTARSRQVTLVRSPPSQLAPTDRIDPHDGRIRPGVRMKRLWLNPSRRLLLHRPRRVKAPVDLPSWSRREPAGRPAAAWRAASSST
jgi:2',3'-cyclic-nucleotide 2'-phosphodiesterase (5'-nucleotidase family)